MSQDTRKTRVLCVFGTRPDAVKMAGLNGVRAMKLDGEYLAGVAARIGAPTLERLTTPVETFPEILPGFSCAVRRFFE